MRPIRPLLCLGLLATFLVACTGGPLETEPDTTRAAASCGVGAPSWLAEAGELAEVNATTPRDGVTVVDARWDDSALVVGVCLDHPDVAPELALRSGSALLPPAGAILGMPDASGGALLYLIWPSLPRGEVEVGTPTGPLARIRAAESSAPACDLRSSAPGFVIESCGLIVVASWTPGLSVPAAQVELADIAVIDRSDGNALGFYKVRFEDSPDGLRVVFGFLRPQGTALIARLQDVYPGPAGARLPIDAEIELSRTTSP